MPAKELLLYVLAVAVAVLTVFLSIFIYQLSLAVRESRRVIVKADETVTMVQTIVATPLAIIATVRSVANGFLGRFHHEDDAHEDDT